MSNYTRWYREGTVSGTAGSNTVNGTGTYWKTAGLNTGDILKLGGNDYEILSVKSDTQLTISGTLGNAATNSSYAIIRNFTATMSSKIASEVAGLLGDYARFLNTEMATIYGKSAYEIAKANGFNGTEAAWLESLKGAGEITTLTNRVNSLTTLTSALTGGGVVHNSLWGGRNLGTINNTHKQSIASGSFTNMWLGDHWEINGHTYVIVGFNYFTQSSGVALPHVVVSRVIPPSTGAIYSDHTTPPRYSLSNYYTNIRPGLISEFEADFGAGALQTWQGDELILDSNGNITGNASIELKVDLPTNLMATGMQGGVRKVNTSWVQAWAGHERTEYGQLPGFRYMIEFIFVRNMFMFNNGNWSMPVRNAVATFSAHIDYANFYSVIACIHYNA